MRCVPFLRVLAVGPWAHPVPAPTRRGPCHPCMPSRMPIEARWPPRGGGAPEGGKAQKRRRPPTQRSALSLCGHPLFFHPSLLLFPTQSSPAMVGEVIDVQVRNAPRTALGVVEEVVIAGKSGARRAQRAEGAIGEEVEKKRPQVRAFLNSNSHAHGRRPFPLSSPF